jgi:hypothetical protein
VEFSQTLMGAGGMVEVSALPLFRMLEFLPGGKEISTVVDTSASYFQRQQPVEMTTRISYRDAGGAKLTNTIRHNLEIYREIGYATPVSGE